MPTLYADASGVVTHYASGSIGPTAAPPAAASLDFDAETNPQLAGALSVSLAGFRLTNGALSRNGVAVPVNADGAAERDRKLLAAIKAKLDSDTAPTAQELRVILRYLVRRVG